MAVRTFKNYHSNLGFLDLLFNMIVGFVFLFVVSFMLINVEKEKTNIKTQAEFVITLTWDNDSLDDVDLWIEDPEENVMFFKKKEIGLMHLDRDDLGMSNDTITTSTGETVLYPYNQEIASIRGFIPGEWTVNVHMYAKRTTQITNIETKVEKLNPLVQLIAHEKMQMATKGEEITVVRFLMSSEGAIMETNRLTKPLVEKYLTELYGGGY